MTVNDSTNLITNGTFDSNTLDGWQTTGSSTTGYPSAYSGHASLPTTSSIYQTVNITGGGTYSFSYDMGLLYSATGYVTVVTQPSGTPIFRDAAAGNQSSISLTVTETADTQMTITFDCQMGGELDVDNVSLVASEKVFIVGGDFSDPTIPGWVQTGNSSGTMPSVVDDHLSLPAGTSVYQDIVIEDALQLELTCSLSIPDGAAGKFSVTSRAAYSSSALTTLYSSSASLSGLPLFFFLPEGDTVIRLTFSCTSGEVNVDDVVMGYSSNAVITELQTGGHAPWISPGTNGMVEFNVQFNSPGSGDYIQFIAPTDTTLVDGSIPGLTKDSDYTFDVSSGILKLLSDINSVGEVDLTLAVSNSATSNATLGDGTAQYFTADDTPVGDAAAITVIAATVTITEQSVIHTKTDGSTYPDDHPWIFPGMSGDVTFSVDADSTDGAGSYLLFTAPTYTDTSGSTPVTDNYSTITNATLEGLTAGVDYSFSDNRLTLLQDIIWSDHLLTLTLAVDSNMPRFGTLDNGKVQYVRSDGQSMGTPADITVIAASDNTWDNVKSVKMSYIGMQSDDTSTSSTKGTLFVNGELDADENYSAHSIPVFVGITFDLYSTDAGWSTDDFPGPTNDDVNTALTLTGLASDGETLIDISGDFAVTGNTDYRNSYYKATASAPLPEPGPGAGAYGNELNLGAWCPIVYDYTSPTIPGDIDVYIHLKAPLSNGTDYLYTSNGETPAKLTVNFIARKTYQYSDTAGSSNYILVTKASTTNNITYSPNHEPRTTGETNGAWLFRIYIDKTLDQSKYTFMFAKQIRIDFDYPTPDDSYTDFGKVIDSTYVRGDAIKGLPEWQTYGQHLLFPDSSQTATMSLVSSRTAASATTIGHICTHEQNGFACTGSLSVGSADMTVNAGEIAFIGFSVDYKNCTEGDATVFNTNNSQNAGISRIDLVDNFGNHVYMTPNFSVDNGNSDVSMTVTVNSA